MRQLVSIKQKKETNKQKNRTCLRVITWQLIVNNVPRVRGNKDMAMCLFHISDNISTTFIILDIYSKLFSLLSNKPWIICKIIYVIYIYLHYFSLFNKYIYIKWCLYNIVIVIVLIKINKGKKNYICQEGEGEKEREGVYKLDACPLR